MTDYTKCFASCDGKCVALTETLCSKGKKCSFFKTKQQVKEEQQRTDSRLEKMGIASLIKDKYNI